jgi:hypothetical protein
MPREVIAEKGWEVDEVGSQLLGREPRGRRRAAHRNKYPANRRIERGPRNRAPSSGSLISSGGSSRRSTVFSVIDKILSTIERKD